MGNGVDPFAPGVNFGYGAGPYYSFCFAVPLGVEDDKKNTFTVYPNPVAGDVLFLHSDVAVVQATVTDVRGKTVAVFSNPENKLQIAGMASGTYFLHAVLENGHSEIVRFSVQ